MALSHSPQIATDGLVFYYDMNNPQKSCRGKPTTNLANVGLNGMSGVSLSFLGIEDGWKKYSMSGTFTGGTYPYVLNITSVSFTGGVTYSSACYVKTNARSKFNYFGTGMNYVNQPMNKSGTSIGVLQEDGSYYCGRSNFAYTNTTTQPGYILSNPINNTTFNAATDFVWIYDGQIEVGEFSTPFAGDAGTRSNTESIIDLTNNNTVTANSLTYAADGSFGFNGSSNTITIPKPIISNTPYSVTQWIRAGVSLPDTTNSASRKTPLVGPGPVWNPGYWLTGRVFRVHANTEYRDVTINWVNDLTWHQIGQIFDGTTCFTVIDGQIILGTRIAYSPPTTTTILIGSEITAGNAQSWNGDIGVTQFYNRALSAQEVQQNFNSLRGRYGI